MVTEEQLSRLADIVEEFAHALADAARSAEASPSAAPDDGRESRAEFPAMPGLYWVLGRESGTPVQGVARRVVTDGSPRLESVDLDPFGMADWSIWQSSLDKVDRLEECVPLVAVPMEMVAQLMAADRDDVWDVQEDLISWVREHPQAGDLNA